MGVEECRGIVGKMGVLWGKVEGNGVRMGVNGCLSGTCHAHCTRTARVSTAP